MQQRKHKLASVAAGVMLALGGMTAAYAAPSYGPLAPPGTYFGSGNVNADWFIETVGNIQLGLRAKERFGPTNDGSTGVYSESGATVAGKAAWNYEISVNVGLGASPSTLSAYIVTLKVDTDPTAATNFTTLTVYSNWPDNEYFGPGTTQRDATNAQRGPIAGEFALQQSANPFFPDSGFGFIPGPGLYDLQLSIYSSTDTGLTSALATDNIQVQVPEPASLALLGLGLAGLGFSRRKKA